MSKLTRLEKYHLNYVSQRQASKVVAVTPAAMEVEKRAVERVGDNAWMGKKYGRLNKETWRDDLRAGFAEAFRVLWPHGVLIFKWNETQIPVSNILVLTDEKPVIRQRTGKSDKTHWVIFVKGGAA